MIKNPAYIIPLAGLYIFSFGYVYEWGYLSEFHVAHQVVNHTYDEFLVLATHALTVVIRSSNAITLIFFTSVILGVIYYISKTDFYIKWIQTKKEKKSKTDEVFLRILVISISPLCLILLFLIPGLLGYFEAKALKSASDKYWQEIEIKGNPPLKITGMIVRKISDYTLFYEKNDPITHIISNDDILAIRQRTTSHNKSTKSESKSSNN